MIYHTSCKLPHCMFIFKCMHRGKNLYDVQKYFFTLPFVNQIFSNQKKRIIVHHISLGRITWMYLIFEELFLNRIYIHFIYVISLRFAMYSMKNGHLLMNCEISWQGQANTKKMPFFCCQWRYPPSFRNRIVDRYISAFVTTTRK